MKALLTLLWVLLWAGAILVPILWLSESLLKGSSKQVLQKIQRESRR